MPNLKLYILATMSLAILMPTPCSTRRLERHKCKDPECYMTIRQLVESKGYVFEEHTVTTKDGVVLTLHRIPRGRNGRSNGEIMLLQHGLLDSSATWLLNHPSQSAGFVFADAGFDVWMGNSRGNGYSQGSDSKPGFWDFSWDQMAHYDLPAMVGHVLNATSAEALHYVAHSQGTMVAFAKLGCDAALNAQLASFHALAPVSRVGNVKGLVSLLEKFGTLDTIVDTLDLLQIKQLLGTNPIVTSLIRSYCSMFITQYWCHGLFYGIAGPDSTYLNQTRIPVILTFYPSSTSVMNAKHFLQMMGSGNFQAFDWGSDEENIAHYGQTNPPIYATDSITTPVSLYYGGNDYLADESDVALLRRQLSSVVRDTRLALYNHLDFIWGIQASRDIYANIIDDILNK